MSAPRSRHQDNPVAVVEYAADLVPAHLDHRVCAVLLRDHESENAVGPFLLPPDATRHALHRANLPDDPPAGNSDRPTTRTRIARKPHRAGKRAL